MQLLREHFPGAFVAGGDVDETGGNSLSAAGTASGGTVGEGGLAVSAPATTHSSIADELAAEIAILKGYSAPSAREGGSRNSAPRDDDGGDDGGGGKRARVDGGDGAAASSQAGVPKPPVRLLCRHAEVCRAVVVVWFPGPVVDVVKAIHAFMERVIEEKTAHARKLVRFIPLQLIIPAQVDAILAAGTKLALTYMPVDTPTTWAAEVKMRNNNSFTRDHIYYGLQTAIPHVHRVSLVAPTYRILVEVFQKHAGISIVRDSEWSRYRQYNIQTLAETDDETAARKAVQATRQAEADARKAAAGDGGEGEDTEDRFAEMGGVAGTHVESEGQASGAAASGTAAISDDVTATPVATAVPSTSTGTAQPLEAAISHSLDAAVAGGDGRFT